MNTINGNNKEERLINKAKKYLGLELRKISNKYYKNVNTPENVFSYGGEWKVSETKFGVRLILNPLNSEKPIFLPTWAVMQAKDRSVDNKNFFCFKAYGKVLDQCNELVKGADDLRKIEKDTTFTTYSFSTMDGLDF